MDKDWTDEFKRLEQENRELIQQVRSPRHLTANEELKKGVAEDFFDSIFGEDT